MLKYPPRQSKGSYLGALVLFAFVALFLLLLGQLPVAKADNGPLAPEEVVAKAWQLARDSGRYGFESQIEQTNYPVPSLTNAGRPPQSQQIVLSGAVDSVNETSELTFWNGVKGTPEQGLTIRTEDGRTQQRLGLGNWEPMEQNSDLFVPNNDPLTFLQVATNIQAAGIDVRQFGEHSLTYSVYTFDIDSSEYSQIMKERLEEYVAQFGQLPDGLTLKTPDLYREMTGSGQIWLDSDGLPGRLVMDLSLPSQGNAGPTEATLTSDFNNYDRSRLAVASIALWENPQSWWTFREVSILHGVRQTAVAATIIFGLIAFFLLLMPHRETKTFQTALALLVITSMLTTPLLRGFQAQSFQDNYNAARRDQEIQQEKNEQLAAIQAQKTETNFDPHTPVSEQMAVTQEQWQAGAKEQANSNKQLAIDSNNSPLYEGSLGNNLFLTSTDTDGDGVTDEDEADWYICAYLGAPDYCDGVVDSTDSDGDGLKDGVEIYNLTTHPGHWDSDGDAITDTLEVNGFFYNGQMWYLNPNEKDSNKDGLIDSLECLNWTAGSSYDPAAPCPDTDNDGTPDVWDDDNDNDGVVDGTDISPLNVGSQVYSVDNPMTLEIDGLQPNFPVFVDVHFRPQDPGNLDLSGVVLDWPSGDTEGQIQRRLDTTFATTANSQLQATDSMAGNGDIRLVPIVEVRIPYASGHYGNLPILPAYEGIPRTLSMTVDDWLDTSKLDPYGITVNDAVDGSGDLLVSLPLTPITDAQGGGRAAYAFRMLYWPEDFSGQTVVDWGNAHEFRVKWYVQLISDECVNSGDDPATCTRQDVLDIIHVYDEDWTVTGMSIKEEHDYDVAILYEDPAQDSNPDFEDDLWMASWNLNNQFLRARDCDTLNAGVCQGDGQRDVTIANMDSQINSWSGGNDAIEVSTFDYDHSGFMAHVMMTETVNLLETVFTPANVTTTTLMFASESTVRSSNLGVAEDNSGALTFDLTDIPTFTTANLSWSPFRELGGNWENDDPTQQLDRMVKKLAQEPFFIPEDASLASQEDAEGKLIWVELYYLSLYQGLSTRVAVEDDPLFDAEDDYGKIPEDEYEIYWPPSTFNGASTLAFAYLTVIYKVYSAKVAQGTIWQQLSRGFSKTYPVNSINTQFSGLQTATNVLIGTTSIMAIVGFAVFTAGYISGDAKLRRVGEIILNTTTLILASVAVANYIIAFQLADSVGAVSNLSGAYSFSYQNNVIGNVGVLIQIAIAWGTFVYFAQTTGVLNSPKSIGFNMLLAFAIAQTIVALLFYFITLAIPIVGNLIVLAIIIAEAILSFFGKTGAQAWLTEKIADALYDVDFVINNLNSADRLEYSFFNIDLLDDSAGFTTDQTISYTMKITNTLKYSNEHGPDAAKKATFRYFLQGDPIDMHELLSLNQMNNDWKGAGNNKIETVAFADLLGGPISFSSIGVGINRSFGGRLYLTESYVTPYIGCWQVLTFNTSCTTYPYSGTVHINVGQFSVFDILPNSVAGFHSMVSTAYSSFPSQIDPDGDGLVAGTDPYPLSSDGDGDGLTDYFEIANGFDPRDADGDGDGLTDSEELRRGLDPHNQDPDDDGLSDLDEWIGWPVVYDYDESDNPLLTWTWSNPYLADADEDRLSDLEEYFYSLNPNISSSIDEVLDTIEFSDATISEEGSPSLLLRFDEESDATSFLDNAQAERASCGGDTCPASGEIGRYNHGVEFDGVNDYLRTPFVLDPGSESFTAAAWFNVNDLSENRTILQQANGSVGTSRAWLYLLPSGKVATSLSGSGLTTSQSAVLNEWHHAAVTYDGVTLKLYLDGQLGASGARTLEASDGDVLVGIDALLANRPFSGSIDEVVMYNSALDEDTIAAIAAARYNVADNVVIPGEDINFSTTISNSNPVLGADVVYYQDGDIDFSSYVEDEPYAYLSFDEPVGSETFNIEYLNGGALNATCEASLPTCPQSVAGGVSGNAISFNGSQMLNVKNILNSYPGGSGGYSFSFWAKPDGTTSNKYFQIVMSILKSGTGTDWSDYRTYFSHIVHPNGGTQYWFGPDGGPGLVVQPGEWVHFTVIYDTLSQSKAVYANGVYLGNSISDRGAPITLSSNSRFYLGGIQTSVSSFDENYRGMIDEFVFYNRLLTADDAMALYQGQNAQLKINEEVPQLFQVGALSTTEINDTLTIPNGQPSGSFLFRQLAEASLRVQNPLGVSYDPTLRLHFDEPVIQIDVNLMPRRVTAYPGEQLLCRLPSSGVGANDKRCPSMTAGLAGLSATMDGTDQGMRYNLSTQSSSGPWTIGAWVNPSHVGAADVAVLGGGSSPTLYINSSDQLGFGFNNSGWNNGYAAGTIPRNDWSHVAVTHDGTGNYQLYLNGIPIGDDSPITGTLIPGSFTGWVGYAGGSPYDYFTGQIDNVTFYDVMFDESEVAALYSQDDLSLHLHLTFDDPPGSTNLPNLVGIYGNATCSNCPLLGIRSMLNRGAYFDNNLLQSAVPDYWKDDETAGFTFAAWMQLDPQGIIAENRSIREPFRIYTNRYDMGWSTVDNTYDDSIAHEMASTQWAHVIVSHGANGGGLFINGVKVNNDLSGSPFSGPGSQQFKIGQSLTGYMDDIRLYQRGFTEADAMALYLNSAPQLQFEFEEAASATEFEDTSDNGGTGQPFNAISGLAGRVGNGLTLNGDGYVVISDTDALDSLTNDLTIMAWIKPADVDTKQWIVAPSLENSSNGFGLGIESGVLFFETFGNGGDFTSIAPVIANTWQHVTVVFSQNNNAFFYIDGELIDTVTGAAPALANNDDAYYIGASTNPGTMTAVDNFNGNIDELSVHQRSLTAAEINSAYINQFRWFRKQFDTYLTVDNDVPTITLQTTKQYWANDYIQLAVGTTDTTSAIWSFEFGLQAPGEINMTWQSAPACADVTFGTVWCPYFDPSTMAGEGEYQLQFRAVDSVGNETTSPVYSLYVDDTPPVVTSDDVGGWRNLSPIPDIELGWELPLSGTVTDPLLNGGAAGSGVYSPTVYVQLVNKHDQPLTEPQQATVSGNNWNVDYEILGHPHGRFYVKVQAADVVGNTSITNFNPDSSSTFITEGELRLDARPPTVDADSWLMPGDVISDAITLSGSASELPVWGDALARYHFEEPTAATDIYDNSPLENNATCTNCPSPSTGLFGQAYSFDGVDDSIDTPFLFNPVTDTFSVAIWFYMDSSWSGTGSRTLVQQESDTGPGRNLLYVNPGYTLRSNLGLGNGGGMGFPTAVTADEWHHAALTYDGTTARLYLDGELGPELDVAAEPTLGGLNFGSSFGTTNFLLGMLDEAMVFDRALTMEEIIALATAENAGISNVDVWLETFNFDGTHDTPDWQPALVDAPLDNLSTWSYVLPNGLEDFYQIKVRGTDDLGNVGRSDTVWRGIIDMVSPVVSVSAVHLGGGSAAQTEITFAASDHFLAMDTIDAPCPADTWQTSTYQADQTRIDSVFTTCRLPGHIETPITIEACDLAGHCVGAGTLVPPSPDISSVAILSPTHNANIVGTVLTVPIGGGAYDTDGIEAISLQIDGVPFDSITIGGGTTDTNWSLSDWQPTTGGTYTLTAVMTDSLNSTVTDTVTVHVEIQNCFTEIDGDTFTDFTSEDGSAVQMAVDAAPAGSTIKVAGLCRGTEALATTGNTYTQTVYISKSLTLEGGYEPGGDWSLSDPGLYETKLDAAGDGRPVTIYYADQVTIKDLTLTGGYSSEAGGPLNPANSGGGLYLTNSSVLLENVTVTGNHAQWYGSGIYQDEGQLTITNSQIISNSHPTEVVRRGGGILTDQYSVLTMTNTLVANNESQGGAGIYTSLGTIIYLKDSIVRENEVTAVNNVGGGFFLGGSSLTIEGSEISGNIAKQGAGIYAGTSTITMLNSTVSGNQAYDKDGGIFASGAVTISFSTIVSNTGSSGVEFTGAVSLTNTIIANHTQDCFAPLPGDGGYNLDSDGSCGWTAGTSVSNADPLLMPLALNGGTTANHLPELASPVYNAIPVGVNGCGITIVTDQRGEIRPKGAGCDIGSVERTPNTVPVANGESYNLTEDITFNLAAPGILGNDVDDDGQPLTAVLDTNVTSGTLDLSASGAFTYTGQPDFCGTDQFSYSADDGYDLSIPAIVTLNVSCVNDDPVAANNTYTVTEDSPATLLDVLLDDSDIDGDTLSISQIGPLSAGGTAVNNTNTISYTPASDYFGVETFTYTISDGNGGSDIATVTMNITPVNDAPVAASDSYTTAEGLTLTVPAPGVLDNDLDVDNVVLTAVLTLDVVSGTLTLNDDGGFTYTPDADFCGQDSFDYEASDGMALSSDVSVTLFVTCLPPTGNAGGPYQVDESGSVILDGSNSIPLLPIFTGELTYEWDFDYDGTTFDINGTGITTTLSAAALDGPALFTIGLRVTDEVGLSDIVTTSLTVNNLPPMITSVTATDPITLPQTSTITVLASDPIGSADPLTYAFDCNNDLIYEIGPQSGNTAKCVFTEDGTFTVNVLVDDGDGGQATGNTTVTVFENPVHTIYMPIVTYSTVSTAAPSNKPILGKAAPSPCDCLLWISMSIFNSGWVRPFLALAARFVKESGRISEA